MRMIATAAVAAVLAVPTSARAGAAWFDAVLPAPERTEGLLDMPVERVPGRALVKLHGLDPRDLAVDSPRFAKAQKLLGALEERTGVALELVRPSLLGWGLYDVRDRALPKERPSEARTLVLVDRLAGDPAVAAASDDRWYRTQALPTDPAVGDMWHLQAIGAYAAWDITTGTSAQRIGVVDTGTLRDHEELSAKAVAGYDFISSAAAAGDGDGRDSDFNDEGDGADCGFGYEPDSWHGSHVAGTILASTNNGAGIAGINWRASLVTARAMGRCGGALSDIMEGAAWMAGASIDGVPSIGGDKVSVMNLSLGGDGGCTDYEQDVIDFINDQGVVFVAAAGNNGGSVGSPANCDDVISVAAHGPGANRPLAPYSSFGSTIEVVAPGGYISGTPENGVLSLSGPGVDDYTWQQGTSMAAPHVTGAISLLQVYEPGLDRGDLAELFDDNGDSCSGCGGVRALRVDLLLDAIGASPLPPEEEPPAEEPPVDEPPAEEPPVGDDPFEPNGAWEQRAPIACGDDLSLFMAEGDVDWFTFTAPADVIGVRVFSGADLDLFVTVGPTNDDVLDASTTETGNEMVQLSTTGGELSVAVLPWMDASGDYRLVVSCGAAETDPADPADPSDDPPSSDPADEGQDPSTPPDGAAAPIPTEDGQQGTMTRAEPMNGGLRGGCAQASGSATPLAVLLLGLVALLRRPRRRGR